MGGELPGAAVIRRQIVGVMHSTMPSNSRLFATGRIARLIPRTRKSSAQYRRGMMAIVIVAADAHRVSVTASAAFAVAVLGPLSVPVWFPVSAAYAVAVSVPVSVAEASSRSAGAACRADPAAPLAPTP